MFPNNDLSAWNLGGPPAGQPGYPSNMGGGFPQPSPGFPDGSIGGAYPGMGATDPFGFPPLTQPDFNTGYGGGFAQPAMPSNYPAPSAYPSGADFMQPPAAPVAFQPTGPPSLGPNLVNAVVGIPDPMGPGMTMEGVPGPVGPYGDSPYGASFPETQQGSTMGFQGSNPQEDIYAPTLKPYPNFDPSQDCERLRKAMKGLGTDEKTIIEIMGKRTADQRAKIVLQYKTMYGKDLIKEFKSELSGHLGECVEALCYTLVDFDAMQLRKSVKGAGTDEDALIEILCSRTNAQIRQIKEAYARMYPGRSLEKDVMSDTSRHFKRIMISLLQANRDESLRVDRNEARRDAEELYRAGEKRLGTDESKFNMILASKSFAHLRAVFEEYATVSKNDIEKALKSEMSGDLLKSMLAIVRCIRNKQKYFAYMLMKSMKGLGTKDRTLIRLVVSRCEIDMELIKKEFQIAQGKSLESWIADDTTGDYRRLLLSLVSG